jgi:hypothetical protein
MNSTSLPVQSPAPLPAPTSIPSATLGVARTHFEQLRGRARRGIWIETLGLLGLLLVAFAVPSFLTDRGLRLEWAFRFVLLASFVVVLGRIVLRRLVRPLTVRLDDEEMALAVERQSPEVKQALISSLQFEGALQAQRRGDSPEMMVAVIDDVRGRLAAIPFTKAIDAGRVRRFAGACALTLAFFGGWAAIDGASLSTWARRNLLLSNVDWPRYTTLTFAEMGAGEVRLPQGDALTVRVTVDGPMPEQVFVNYVYRGGEKGTEPMSLTGDREFTWVLDAVVEDVVLTAEGGDALPVELHIKVVERPRIQDLAVRVTYPDYMEREPELLPPTEGDLRLPRGAKLSLSGKSHKPIDDAFVLFGSDRKVPLQRAADGFSFAGDFLPDASGLLVVDVIDKDKLGAGAPPKLLLRVGDDKPPTIDFRLRGIGTLITTHAVIPGDLKVKDDFGLRGIDASYRVTEEMPTDQKPGEEPTKPVEVPFADAVVTYYGSAMTPSALRYESPASIDLRQWNTEPDQNAPTNPIRPGMLVSMRFGATDNFGPGEPHHTYGETLTFRVVTREKLLEELRRRQVEQRQELQRVVDDEQTAMLELREMVELKDAGDRASLVKARLKALARQQQVLGRRAAFVGDLYQRILWEYENNRLIESNKVRQMESLIPVPLAAIAKEAFPASGRLVDGYSGSGLPEAKVSALATYDDILRRLQAVLKEMEQAESLAALLEDLRVVIKIEDSVIKEVENRKEAEEQSVFGDHGKDDPLKKVDPTPDSPKKNK